MQEQTINLKALRIDFVMRACFQFFRFLDVGQGELTEILHSLNFVLCWVDQVYPDCIFKPAEFCGRGYRYEIVVL